MYIKRDVEALLIKDSKFFQVITVYGSRQVGKTTTVLHLFGKTFNFVSLDDTDELMLAQSSPKAFLNPILGR